MLITSILEEKKTKKELVLFETYINIHINRAQGQTQRIRYTKYMSNLVFQNFSNCLITFFKDKEQELPSIIVKITIYCSINRCLNVYNLEKELQAFRKIKRLSVVLSQLGTCVEMISTSWFTDGQKQQNCRLRWQWKMNLPSIHREPPKLD